MPGRGDALTTTGPLTLISQKFTQNASPNKYASDHHTGSFSFSEPVSSKSTLVLRVENMIVDRRPPIAGGAARSSLRGPAVVAPAARLGDGPEGDRILAKLPPGAPLLSPSS